MRVTGRVTIENNKGIHARVAAMVVRKCQKLMDSYNCQLFVKREDDESIMPGNSMLALVSMKIRQGETIEILSEPPNLEATEEFVQFLTGSVEVQQNEIGEIDNLIQDNMLASDKIFQSIPNGLIVVDNNNIITVFNKAAERITNISSREAVGKNSQEVLASLKLAEFLQGGEEEFGVRQSIGKSTIITNRTPIFLGGKVMGAVAVFQDITELEFLSGELDSFKDLKGKLEHVLETVDEGICITTNSLDISYTNRPFKQMIGSPEGCVGQKAFKFIPKDVLHKAIKENSTQTCLINEEKGSEFMVSVRPINIGSSTNGTIIFIKEITQIHKLIERVEELSAKTNYLQEELNKKQELNQSFNIITGKSGPLVEALSIASKAAETNATVLIRGESGTGKELVAKGIHFASPRKNKAFVKVNCAAIPENLLESELFGYEKGAFTGATQQKLGKFELANGGTIFLDEIGDMGKDMQSKLLRVLQEKEIERVGGLKTIKIDVRVIAATNTPLEDLIAKGEFRQDLYYRLNVIPVILPSLRERKGDIPLLADHFVGKMAKKHGFNHRKIQKSALRCLENYPWPGNVRELENIIERAMTLANGDVITLNDLPNYLRETKESQGLKRFFEFEGERFPTMEEIERLVIQKALGKYKSYRKVGEALGLNHKTVASKARKYNLEN